VGGGCPECRGVREGPGSDRRIRQDHQAVLTPGGLATGLPGVPMANKRKPALEDGCMQGSERSDRCGLQYRLVTTRVATFHQGQPRNGANGPWPRSCPRCSNFDSRARGTLVRPHG
jgi:hypothetical protein